MFYRFLFFCISLICCWICSSFNTPSRNWFWIHDDVCWLVGCNDQIIKLECIIKGFTAALFFVRCEYLLVIKSRARLPFSGSLVSLPLTRSNELHFSFLGGPCLAMPTNGARCSFSFLLKKINCYSLFLSSIFPVSVRCTFACSRWCVHRGLIFPVLFIFGIFLCLFIHFQRDYIVRFLVYIKSITQRLENLNHVGIQTQTYEHNPCRKPYAINQNTVYIWISPEKPISVNQSHSNSRILLFLYTEYWIRIYVQTIGIRIR